MILVMANWFDARLVYFWGITLDAGTIVFPLTFIISDMITEVYGYKNSRRAIWIGFAFNILFVAYGQLVIHLPSPPYYHNNEIFTEILSLNTRIVIASLISYLCAEPLNALVIAKWKVKTQGKHMALRFVSSTVMAALLDSIIFISIAFSGTMPVVDLIKIIVSLWLAKVVIEIIGLPFSVVLTKKLKQREQLDIFDTNTNFSLFSFEAIYQEDNNQINHGQQ